MTQKHTFRKQPDIGDHRKIFCNTCNIETHHELKYVHKRNCSEFEEGIPLEYVQAIYWEDFEYRLWICCGCDTGILEESYTSIGMGEGDGQIWESIYYPTRKRREIPNKRFVKLDIKLSNIYNEVIGCFNQGQNVLCAVGLRALLEGICVDKGITKGNLEKKIDSLEDYLPQNIVISLHSFRFMGNKAAHEMQAPGVSELKLAIEVMEDLLNFLYDLDYKASRLPRTK